MADDMFDDYEDVGIGGIPTKPFIDKDGRKRRYVKPSITNLPHDLGMMIYNQITNTPPTDFTELNRKAREAERRLGEILDREAAEKKAQEHVQAGN